MIDKLYVVTAFNPALKHLTISSCLSKVPILDLVCLHFFQINRKKILIKDIINAHNTCFITEAVPQRCFYKQSFAKYASNLVY